MSKKILVNFDFNQNELQNIRIQNLGAFPSNPVPGQIIYRSDEDRYYGYDGTSWKKLDLQQDEFESLESHGNEWHDPNFATEANFQSLENDFNSHEGDRGTGVHGTASQSVDGFMSAGDKTKLDNVEAGATNYDSDDFNTDFSSKSTDDLSEGTTNKYLQGTEVNQGDNISLLTNDEGYTDYTFSENYQDLTNRTHGDGDHTENYEKLNNKGEAGGYAPLDSNSLVPASYLPETARQRLWIANDYPERDDLESGSGSYSDRDAFSSEEAGDKVIVLESGNTYIWDGTSWQLQSEDMWGEVNLDWSNIENKSHGNESHDVDFATDSDLTSLENNFNSHKGSTGISEHGTASSSSAGFMSTSDYDKLSNIEAGANNYDSSDFNTDFNSKSTDDLSEGTTNKYLQGTEINEGDNISLLTNDEGYLQKHAETIGDGSATTFTVTHNLGTRDLTVMVYENGSPYSQVLTSVGMPTSDTVEVKFSQAPSTDEYRVVVTG